MRSKNKNGINSLAFTHEPSSLELNNIRDELISNFKKILGGDEIAAEYLLLHLLSRVYFRHGDIPIGLMSLNIHGFESCTASAQVINDVFATLLEKHVSLNLDCKMLCSRSLMVIIDNYHIVYLKYVDVLS